jgi:hypothetical protein
MLCGPIFCDMQRPFRHKARLPVWAQAVRKLRVELARRNFVSITLNRKRTALAFERGKGENNSAHCLLASVFTQVGSKADLKPRMIDVRSSPWKWTFIRATVSFVPIPDSCTAGNTAVIRSPRRHVHAGMANNYLRTACVFRTLAKNAKARSIASLVAATFADTSRRSLPGSSKSWVTPG